MPVYNTTQPTDAALTRMRGASVECSQCHETRFIPGYTRWDQRADWVDSNGHPVTEFIRFLPNRGEGQFHTWCRACERAAGARRRSANPGGAGNPRSRAARFTDRKFGVELELKFPRGRSVSAITDALEGAGLQTGRGAWRVRSDGSLGGGNGWEIVSPPLSGEDGFEQLKKACRALREIGGKPDRQCGLHIHHEIRDLNLPQIKRMARGWSNAQSAINRLVSASRRGGNMYCRPLSDHDLREIENLRELRPGTLGVERYRTMNLQAFGRYGTVEIRQHQGSVDFVKIVNWIRLGQAIIETAKAEAQPIPAQTTVQGLFAALGERLNESASTFLLGRAVQLNPTLATV